MSTQNGHASSLLGSNNRALLFPSRHLAESCLKYLQSFIHYGASVKMTIFTFQGRVMDTKTEIDTSDSLDEYIHAVTFPEELESEAKAFWQHTGYGISSRRARFWLDNAPFLSLTSRNDGVSSILPQEQADTAACVLRERIASLLSTNSQAADVEGVFLYPTGMSSISHSATALRSTRASDHQTCCVAVFG